MKLIPLPCIFIVAVLTYVLSFPTIADADYSRGVPLVTWLALGLTCASNISLYVLIKSAINATGYHYFIATHVVMTSALVFAQVYKYSGLLHGGSGDAIKNPTSTEALYFSVVTLTTLGYGDLQPAPQMRLVAAFQAVFGLVLFGLLIDLLTGKKRSSVQLTY